MAATSKLVRIIGAVAGMALLLVLGAVLGRSSKPAALVAPPAVPPLPTGDIGPLTAEQRSIVEFRSRGAMFFVLFHEMGHMVISELKLPAIGPQEDVADEFATFVLTEFVRGAPENQKDLYAEVVFSGAVFWRIAGQEREARQGGAGATGGIDWFDEHSPDLRRYFNILCLATGADPLRFIPKAIADGVPESRLHSCAEEYKTKHAAWDALMDPHMPGTLRKLLGIHHLKLEYGPAVKTEWLAFETVYRQGGYFQQLLDAVSSTINLPEDIPVVVEGCNQINAWWSPDDKKITLCHDFFERLTATFARAVVGAARQQAQQQGGGGGGAPAPPAPPAPGNQPSDAEVRAALVGAWTCTSAAGREESTLEAGGAFKTELFFAAGGGTLSMTAWGTWSEQSMVLRYDFVGSNPPASLPQTLVPFQMPQPNVMLTKLGRCDKKAGVGIPQQIR
jgi:hypothetical protein